MEEFSKIVHRGRKHHLVERTGGQIKNWYPNKLTDDQRINSDNVSINIGLQYSPLHFIFSHLQVGIK
jgi:hypothetical protein